MHNEDTQTITTDASRYAYSMALVRAIADHLAAADDPDVDRPSDVVVYVPHWLEAGEPWRLFRDGESPEWIVSRSGGHYPHSGARFYGFSLRFGDAISEVAAAMLAHDQQHPFVVIQEPAFFPTELAA